MSARAAVPCWRHPACVDRVPARAAARQGRFRGGEGRRGAAQAALPLVRFTPAGGGTFTRASEASYYKSPPNTTGNFLAWAANNVIRVSVPDTVPGGYLFEPTRANIGRHSEALDNALWVPTGASITGATAVAPDGEADCRTVTFTASATAELRQLVTGSLDANTYCTSIWVRKTSGAGNIRMQYLLRDGTTATTADIPISTTWKRIEDVRAWGTGATPPSWALLNDAAGTAQAVEAWGFQSERTIGTIAVPGSVIRTTTASVTRSADSLTYASIPVQIQTGRWSFRCSPDFTNAEVASAAAAFGTEGAADSYVLLASAVTAGVIKYTRTPITYARNQVMTLTPDGIAKTMTVAGAASGDGTGPVGVATAWGAGFLRVGAIYNGARAWQGRIWEPYAA